MKYLFFLIILSLSLTASDNKTVHEHFYLRQFEGKWRQIYNIYDEGEIVDHGEGYSENKVILDGRYAELNSVIGKDSLEVKHIIGYDTRDKAFTITIFSSEETYPIAAGGTFYNKNRVFVFKGQYYNDDLHQFEITYEFAEDEKFIYTYYDVTVDFKEKILEVTYIKLD
jgi:hypothetical protein